MGLTLFIVWVLVFGTLCGFIAREKGRDTFSWVLLGALFGIFAVVAICAVPALGPAQPQPVHQREATGGEHASKATTGNWDTFRDTGNPVDYRGFWVPTDDQGSYVVNGIHFNGLREATNYIDNRLRDGDELRLERVEG